MCDMLIDISKICLIKIINCVYSLALQFIRRCIEPKKDFKSDQIVVMFWRAWLWIGVNVLIRLEDLGYLS